MKGISYKRVIYFKGREKLDTTYLIVTLWSVYMLIYVYLTLSNIKCCLINYFCLQYYEIQGCIHPDKI